MRFVAAPSFCQSAKSRSVCARRPSAFAVSSIPSSSARPTTGCTPHKVTPRVPDRSGGVDHRLAGGQRRATKSFGRQGFGRTAAKPASNALWRSSSSAWLVSTDIGKSKSGRHGTGVHRPSGAVAARARARPCSSSCEPYRELITEALNRVTADSNILISAFLRGGKALQLLELARAGQIELAITEDILSETGRVLGTKFRVPPEDVQAFGDDVRGFTRLVVATEKLDVVKADPTDNPILECAIAAGSETVVTGDGHLLSVGGFRGIEIVRIADFLARFSERSR
jgi:uncharacterized protein